MSIIFDKKQFKEAILSKAFRGELTEQDYDEGTGKELLERIKSERQREQKGKKKVEIAPVAKEEEPYELPPNWTWARLGEVSYFNYGKNLPTSKLIEKGYDVFGANGVIGKYSEYMYEKSQLTISCRGANSGKVNMTPEFCFITNNSIVIQSTSSRKFTYYTLMTQDRKKIVTGTAQPQVTIANLENAIIPLPPLAEQHRIVAKIERAFELIDSMDVDSLLQDISDFRQEILTRAFRGDLTEQHFDEGTGRELLQSIQLERQTQQTKGKKKTELAPVSKEEEPYELPPNWTWTRLGEVHKWISGVTFSKKDTSFDKEVGKIACVKTNHIQLYNFDTNNLVYLPREKVRMDEKLLQTGDVIMSSSNSKRSIGRCCIVGELNEEMSFGAFVSTLRPEKIVPHYLLHFLNNHFWSGTFDNMMNQTINVGNLRKSDIELMHFPLPPLAEQHRIVAKIEAIFSALDVMEDAITKQKDEAKACYEEILRKEIKSDVEGEKELEKTSEEMVEVKVG